MSLGSELLACCTQESTLCAAFWHSLLGQLAARANASSRGYHESVHSADIRLALGYDMPMRISMPESVT